MEIDHKQNKLENPARLAELNPEKTLKQIGLGIHDTVCDIGAGSGVFSIPAAKLTNNTVFAVDINPDLLKVIMEKADKENLKNVMPLKVDGFHYDIDSESIDLVVMVTVLHEIEEKADLFKEIHRIIKKAGKLAIIEFHKRQTPMGPPEPHRISKEETLQVCSGQGFVQTNAFDLGNNLYCIVFASAS